MRKALCGLKTSTITLLVSLCIAASLPAADPAKDPGGWAEVKLGMTPDEVLAALGTDGYIGDAPREVRPFNLDETVDLPAAVAFAKDVIANAKEDSATTGGDLLDACKALLAETRSTNWAYATVSRPGPNMTPQFDPRSIRRISGNLESITSWGAKVTEAYRRQLNIRAGGKVTTIEEQSLDDKSKNRLQKIEQAVADMALAMNRNDEQKKGNADHNPVEASRVKAREVKVRGITLNPSFTFSDNRLTKIVMSQNSAGELSTNFNEIGMQQTLCDALTEKYGPVDQQNRNASSREAVWLFPTTIIRCISSRVSIPGGMTHRGVRIVYEVPDSEDGDEKDKL
jgi:hypothetical protein